MKKKTSLESLTFEPLGSAPAVPRRGFDVKMLRVLKAIKEANGLTYPRLSALIGVSVITLTRWCTKGMGKVHRANRIQVVRFIDGYQKAENAEEFLKGGVV